MLLSCGFGVNRICTESGLFGVSLDVLLEHDRKKFPHLRVPLILKEVTDVAC